MLFWFFLFFCSLLVPATFLGVGWYYTHHTPGRGSAFGYRTPLSSKSDLANAFACQYIGRLWWVIGLVSLPVTLITFIVLLALQLDEDATGWIGGGLIILECIVMLFTILPTELALHRNFNKDGTPRGPEE